MKERQLIERIASLGPDLLPGLLQGIGDDCAVLSRSEHGVLLLTMDTLLQSVHFDLSWHPADKLAQKTVAVNISDIAAMGGRPTWCLLSLGLPPDQEPGWIDSFARGLDQALNRYGCQLIGGDTVSSPSGIALTLTVAGETAADQVLYRHGAREGDTIWVSGPLGLAAAGLALLRHDSVEDPWDRFSWLLEAHLVPRARLNLGRLLARSGLVHSMMDCSDGLATDLAHMCRASKAGARVVAGQLVLHPLLLEAAALLEHDPLDWVLRGGEDYELLFTTAPADAKRLLELTSDQGYRVYPVGTITKGEEVVLVREKAGRTVEEYPITFQGFDHFAPPR